MSKKLSHNEFVKNINDKYPGKYKILTKYNGYTKQIKIKYEKCGHIDTVKAGTVYNGCDCQECKRIYFEKIFIDRFNRAKNSNEFNIIDKYINNHTPIKIEHKCGYSFNIIPHVEREYIYCPKCNPEKYNYAISGISDIYTTNKTLFNLLKNKEDGFKYKENSRKRVDFVCPVCGNIVNERIDRVNEFGVVCRRCGIKTSYAERFMSCILQKIGIKYKTQFSPKWANRKLYDFMFEYNKVKYIIEMDGAFHKKDNKLSGQTKEESELIDFFKNRTAQEHGYIIIRIDCNYNNNRYKFILKNILNSELNNIFDLSKINFEECDREANFPIIKTVVDLWNNGIHDYNEIRKHINYTRPTIRNYLKLGSELGLINMSYEEILKIINDNKKKKIIAKQGTKVKCVQTGEEFDSINVPNKIYHANIYAFLKGKLKHTGHLPDGTPLTWTKIEN